MDLNAFLNDEQCAGHGERVAVPLLPALARTAALMLLWSAAVLSASAEPTTGAVTTFSLSQSGSNVGLLSPYRHGLINDLQINAYPDTRLITPNITINKQWGRLSGWQLSSTHALNTPILFLSTSACDGGCSLAPSVSNTPQLLNLNSHFYLRRQFFDSVTVTPSISVELNAGGFSPTELNQLGLQFNPFRPGYSINTGIDISGNFAENWGYSADLEYFSIAGLSGDPVWGHKAVLFYEWNKNQRVAFGYKYTNGLSNYQYDAHAYPMLDFLWSWE